MSTPQRGTASMVDDAAMADSLSRRDSLKMVVAALLVPLTSALPVEAGRVERDGHLAEALRLREATAAERLVATYGDRAYRLAIRITGNGPDAEETVQDAFWSVIQKIDTFRGDSSLGSWIYRIVANAAYQKLRRRAHRRDGVSLDDALPSFHEDGWHAGPITDWSADIDDPAAQTELRAALSSAIGELPAAYRAVPGSLPCRDHPARCGRLVDSRGGRLPWHHRFGNKDPRAPRPIVSAPTPRHLHVRRNGFHRRSFSRGTPAATGRHGRSS